MPHAKTTVPKNARRQPGKPLLLGIVITSFLAGYTSMVSVRSVCRAVPYGALPVYCENAAGMADCYQQSHLTVPFGKISPLPLEYCQPTDPYCGSEEPCDPAKSSLKIKTKDEQVFDDRLVLLTGQATSPTTYKGIPSWDAVLTGGGKKTTGAGDDGFITGAIDAMMQALLHRLNDTELDMIDWWDTMWYYNLRPALQAMTRQLNAATAQQTENFQSGIDAMQENETNLEEMRNENKTHETVRVSENACVAATASGGFGRAQNFARSMRIAWQNEAQQNGVNRVGSPSSKGFAVRQNEKNAVFEKTFCDPNDNGGFNVCAGKPPTDKYGNSYANADTLVTKNLYNKLTMQVDDKVDGPNEAAVASAMMDNLVNDPTGDPIPLAAMRTPSGHELWLSRRSYLARYGAISSVPHLIAGWRMPGSRLGTWIKEMREDAGVPQNTGEMSDNPSYKEILHAVSIDRLNSQKYANTMLSDMGQIEMEKLTLSSFYLMQLRDYYELLEREALTLSVQVSMMTEGIPQPSTLESKPLK